MNYKVVKQLSDQADEQTLIEKMNKKMFALREEGRLAGYPSFFLNYKCNKKTSSAIFNKDVGSKYVDPWFEPITDNDGYVVFCHCIVDDDLPDYYFEAMLAII